MAYTDTDTLTNGLKIKIYGFKILLSLFRIILSHGLLLLLILIQIQKPMAYKSKSMPSIIAVISTYHSVRVLVEAYQVIKHVTVLLVNLLHLVDMFCHGLHTPQCLCGGIERSMSTIHTHTCLPILQILIWHYASLLWCHFSIRICTNLFVLVLDIQVVWMFWYFLIFWCSDTFSCFDVLMPFDILMFWYFLIFWCSDTFWYFDVLILLNIQTVSL